MGTARSSPTERGFTGCPPATAHNGLDLTSAGQHTPEQRPPGSCPQAAGGRGLTVAAKTSMTSASRSARGQHPWARVRRKAGQTYAAASPIRLNWAVLAAGTNQGVPCLETSARSALANGLVADSKWCLADGEHGGDQVIQRPGQVVLGDQDTLLTDAKMVDRTPGTAR